jgi:hypothetical protein
MRKKRHGAERLASCAEVNIKKMLPFGLDLENMMVPHESLLP